MEVSLLLNTVGALLIAFIWLYYLKRLDVFHPETWFNLLIVFAAGMITPVFVLKLAPLIDYTGWGINGNIVNDFLYSVFGIGFIEELAKIFPVLLIMMVGGQQDEPIDYIIFASASALGFATTENIMYFQHSGSEIMTLRALLSALGHMTDTSIVAYGFVIFTFSKKRNAIVLFFYFLLLAAIAHGLYDFFLLNKSFGAYGFLLTLFCYFVFIEIWATINNNCLNNSPHFTKSIVIDSVQLQSRMMLLFGILLAYQFFAVMLQKNIMTGLVSFIFIAFMLGSIGIVVTTRISRFKLVPGRWAPIKFRLPFTFRGIPYLGGTLQVRGESFNEVHANQLLYKNIEIHPFLAKKTKIKRIIPGYVEDKLFLLNDDVFYLIRFPEPLGYEQYEQELALVKARSIGLTMRYGKYPMAALYLIPKGHPIRNDDHINSFAFVEWVYLKPLE